MPGKVRSILCISSRSTSHTRSNKYVLNKRTTGFSTNDFRHLTYLWELPFDKCTAINIHHGTDQSDQSMVLQLDFVVKVMSRFIVIPLIA